MAKERKKPALKEVAVSLVIWKECATEDQMDSSLENNPLSTGQAKALLIKRPEKGTKSLLSFLLSFNLVVQFFSYTFFYLRTSCRIVGIPID
jgi:hypothetical protein